MPPTTWSCKVSKSPKRMAETLDFATEATLSGALGALGALEVQVSLRSLYGGGGAGGPQPGTGNFKSFEQFQSELASGTSLLARS